MRRITRAIAALAACACLTSCTVRLEGISLGDFGRKTIKAGGISTTVTEPLTDSGYSLSIEEIHIVNSGGIALRVDPTLEDAITVRGPQRLIDTLTVSVDGNRITVRGDNTLNFTGGEIDITVGTGLAALYVATGIELEATLPDATAFDLHVDGAIDGEIDFGTLETLNVTINGAGSLDLDGRCANATVTVNGAGAVDAEALICTAANVTINGAGACEIHVTDTLDATVNGVGAIRYSGNPATVNKSGGGISSVTRD